MRGRRAASDRRNEETDKDHEGRRRRRREGGRRRQMHYASVTYKLTVSGLLREYGSRARVASQRYYCSHIPEKWLGTACNCHVAKSLRNCPVLALVACAICRVLLPNVSRRRRCRLRQLRVQISERFGRDNGRQTLSAFLDILFVPCLPRGI